jgi:tetratricopeptide (TPR) repeat protein
VYAYDPRELTELLVAGQLDASFSSTPLRARELESVSLGEAASSVYCGKTHPLFASELLSNERVLAHPFVATCSPRSEVPDDGFPSSLERRIDIFVGQTEVAMQLCLGEPLLAVLPDFAAQPRVLEGRLRRLALPAIPPAQLYATYRSSDHAKRRVAPLVSALREALAHATDVSAGGVEVAIRRSSPRPEAPDDWLALGDTLFLRAEYRAAGRAYEQALERRAADGDLTPLDKARYALRLARMDIRCGRYTDAEATCTEAVRGLVDSDPVAAAALQATISMARCFRGDIRGAEDALEVAKTGIVDDALVGSHADGPRARALVFRAEGNWLLEAGRAREAVVAYERGWKVCVATADAWERSIALFNMAEAASAMGDHDRAKLLFDAAEQEKTEIGDRWGNAYVHGARGAMLVFLQDPEGAVREASAGIQLASDLDDPKLLSMLNTTLGIAHFARDDDAAALRAFRLSLADAERCDARSEAIRAWLGLSAVSLRRRQLAKARAAATKAHALALENGAGAVVGATLFALAEIAAAAGDSEHSAELYRAAFRSGAGRSPALSPFELNGGTSVALLRLA